MKIIKFYSILLALSLIIFVKACPTYGQAKPESNMWRPEQVAFLNAQLTSMTRAERIDRVKSHINLIDIAFVTMCAVASRQQIEGGEMLGAEKTMDIAQESVEFSHNEAAKGLCHLYRGIVYSRGNKEIIAQKEFQDALPCLRLGQQRRQEGEALFQAAQTLLDISSKTEVTKFAEAVEILEASYEAARDTGDQGLEIRSTIYMSKCYYDTLNFVEALRLARLSYRITIGNGDDDKVLRMISLKTIAQCYEQLHRFDEAKEAYKGVLVIAIEIKDTNEANTARQSLDTLSKPLTQ